MPEQPAIISSCGVIMPEKGIVDFEGEGVDAMVAPELPVKEMIPDPMLRRRLTRLSCLSVIAALKAVKDIDDKSITDIPVIFGTGFGEQDATFSFFDGLIDKGPRLARSIYFSHSVPNTPVSYLSIYKKITAPVWTILQGLDTAEAVLLMGLQMLRSGMESIIAGAADVLPVAHIRDKNLMKYLRARGVMPGEGAGFIILSKPGAKGLGAQISSVIRLPYHGEISRAGEFRNFLYRTWLENKGQKGIHLFRNNRTTSILFKLCSNKISGCEFLPDWGLNPSAGILDLIYTIKTFKDNEFINIWGVNEEGGISLIKLQRTSN